jgi:hypothetical protein
MLKIKTASENSQVDYSLGQLLEAPGGFEKLAAEKLPAFIREIRDYESFGRQVLVAHNITTEEVVLINNEPYFPYAKDLNSHAAVYADDTMIPRMQIEGEIVNVPISTVSSDDTTISIKRLMVQRFNYLERVRNMSGQAIAMVEDKRIIDLVETLLLGASTDAAAPEHAAQIVTEAGPNITKANLVGLRKAITTHDIPVGSFVMHQSRVEDVLLWGMNEIDQLTMREQLETGAKYAFFGVKIITSRTIDVDSVYAFSEPEYVGRMPILKDLTVMLTDTPNKLEKGLFLYEFIGFYLASHKAVAKLCLNYTDGGKLIKFTDLFKVGATQKDESDRPKGFGSLEEA